ncbi:MAG: polyphenol oxidase family protein [Comamonas sp.]
MTTEATGPGGQVPPGFIVPAWPAPPRVRAVFTTRLGGVSAPPWDAMNLGTHVGDDPVHVRENRQRLARYLARRGAPWPLFLDQVHGIDVVDCAAGVADGARADASLSAQPGRACVVMVADCLPVLLASADGRVVAAAHAGWRGLAGAPVAAGPAPDGVLNGVRNGVLEATVRALRQRTASPLVAWLGPCIGPGAFEVGEEVRAAFGPEGQGCFRPAAAPGKYWADLPTLARLRLSRLGVASVSGNDGSPDWCTYGRPALFFSHRRDAAVRGTTGRMAACVWIEAAAGSVVGQPDTAALQGGHPG